MYYDEDTSWTEYKPIEENPIILNFEGCKTLGEFHLILKRKFGFPEYYGENLDALWDCLDGLFYNEGHYLVKIQGFYTLPKDLRGYCKKVLELFDEVHANTPNVEFKVIS